jgi:hypothetical protein
MNPKMNPDLVANIYDENVLSYLSSIFKERLSVVYIEGWRIDGINIHKTIYNILKNGGKLIYTLGQQFSQMYREIQTHDIVTSGFQPMNISFLSSDFLYYYYGQIRGAITQTETRNEEVYKKLIQSENDPRLLFNYKVARLSGEFNKAIDMLRLLDSYIGGEVSFEHDRQCYVVITKLEQRIS